ncbi:19018_t:CDS:2 [Rhizophagus irregularis]|nr:19018_t:CDS:2 [Rhizophagus irregularis]
MSVRLWCLVRGSRSENVFYVTIDKGNFIIDLKDAIKGKIRNEFSNTQIMSAHIDDMLNDKNKLVIPGLTIEEAFGNIKGVNVRVIVEAIFSREPTGLVHIFVDNSNIEIEGKKLISALESVYENQLYIDYGRLLKMLLNGRQIGDDPVIVGSRPLPNDSIWRKIEDFGYRVSVFDKNYAFQEKEVDNELGLSISDAIQEYKRPGIIVLVAGDGDYRPALTRALLRDWIVEIWFWDHAMSQRLKWTNVLYRSDLQTRVMKKYLEINEDAVGTWPDGRSFYMYFDNLEQWKEAKCWVKKMYPGVLEL